MAEATRPPNVWRIVPESTIGNTCASSKSAVTCAAWSAKVANAEVRNDRDQSGPTAPGSRSVSCME